LQCSGPHRERPQDHIPEGQRQGGKQKQQAVRLQPLPARRQKRPVIPGGQARQHRSRRAGCQAGQGRKGLQHIDAAHRQEHPRRRQGQEDAPFQQLRAPEGRGGREDQNGRGQEGQRVGKVQKQQRSNSRSHQGGGPFPPWSRSRHAAQGKGGVSPRCLAGSQRCRQEKANAPGQQPGRLLPLQDDLTVPHSMSLLYFAAPGAASLAFSIILQSPPKKSRREMKGELCTGNFPPVDFSSWL